MKDGVLNLLADIKNILLGIALMIAGLGVMFFGTAVYSNLLLGLGVIVLICGFAKAGNAWWAHEVVDVPDEKLTQPAKSSVPESKIPSGRPVTPKED